MNDYTLYWGADVAQNQDNKTNTGDDDRDKARIKQGIDMFKSHLEKGKIADYTKDDYSHIYRTDYTGNINIKTGQFLTGMIDNY